MSSCSLPVALKPFCISQKYEDLTRIITKRYGSVHGHQLDDLVQVGALHYQQWLERIDLDKINDPFSSAVKIACWQVENYLKKERMHENGVCHPDDDAIRINMEKYIAQKNDPAIEMNIELAINALIDTRDVKKPKNAEGINKIINDDLDTMTYYKRNQTKALMKAVINEFLE